MRSVFLPAVTVAWFAIAGLAEATEAVIVTQDSRSFTGVVDARSDAEFLWLRRDETAVTFAFATPWRVIRHATADGEVVDVESFRQQATELATERPATRVLLGPIELTTHEPGHPRRAPAVALSIAACPENWDADPAADGLGIEIVALDRDGRPTPVRGSLVVRLLGDERTTRHRRRYGELQRWSESVKPEHFGPHGAARYRLPYRSLRPEQDSRVGWQGVVYARLGVFGQGSLAASAPVQLRGFSPLRDRVELRTGSRWLPGENASSRRPLNPAASGYLDSRGSLSLD